MPLITYADKTSGISEATAGDYNMTKNVVNAIAPSVFNVKYPYGALGDGVTNDTVAIQAAIDACIANGGGIVFFPIGVYIVSGALQATYNSQLKIAPLSFSEGIYSSITLAGECEPSRQGLGAAVSSAGNIVQSLEGVIIRSTLTSSSGNKPSVIATIKQSSTRFNNNTIFLRNIKIQTTVDTNNKTHMSAVNFGLATAASLENCLAGLSISTADADVPGDGTVGFHMPYISSNTNMSIRNCVVSGYKHGYVIGEHVVLDNADAFGCVHGFTFLPSTYTNVGVRMLAEWCVNAVNTDISDLYIGDMPSGITETVARVIIHCLNVEIEEGVGWQQTDYFINDPTNVLCGSCGVAGFSQSDDADWPDSFIKNGAANMLTWRLHPNNGAADWTVTGSRGDGTALANLFTVLERRGVIVDDTTA